MGQDPKPTERRRRLGKQERAAAQEQQASKTPPLLDDSYTTHIPLPVARHVQRTEAESVGVRLREVLEFNSDGVLKICPTENPLVCYLYWRWSRGKWAGYYLCVLCSLYELSSALALLSGRIAEVQMGQRRPTRDRYQG